MVEILGRSGPRIAVTTPAPFCGPQERMHAYIFFITSSPHPSTSDDWTRTAHQQPASEIKQQPRIDTALIARVRNKSSKRREHRLFFLFISKKQVMEEAAGRVLAAIIILWFINLSREAPQDHFRQILLDLRNESLVFGNRTYGHNITFVRMPTHAVLMFPTLLSLRH